MVKCCVDGCRSNSKFSTDDITFHRFPDVRCFPKLFSKWLQKVSGCPEDEAHEMAPQPSPTDRVCSLHFTEGDFAIRTDRNRTRRALRVEALPTQRLPLEKKTWGPVLSELTISQVTGNFVGQTDTNGTPDTNGIQHLQSPDEGSRNDCSFANRANLPPKMARKKIKLEQKEDYRVPLKSTLERDELEALIQAKQSEIALSNHPDSSGSQPRCNGDEADDDSHIPPCFRAKKNLHSLFAYVITPLDPEHGFDLIMVNDNKYIKSDIPNCGSQMWRCILKNCAVRVTTSAIHCSILLAMQGVHYHLPTKDLSVNPLTWVRTVEPSWDPEPESAGDDEDPDIEVEEIPCGDSQPEPTAKVPPWVRSNTPWVRPNVDSRFGVKDLFAPNVTRFQPPNMAAQPAMAPIENLQAAFASLTKYSGGQLIAAVDPFSAVRFQGSDAFPSIPLPNGMYPRSQSIDDGIVPQRTSSTSQQEEQDYVQQSPASAKSNIIVDEASEGSGSSSEPLGQRLGEPLYHQLVDEVDVQAIIHKDPLALEESNDGHPNCDSQQPTEGPGMSSALSPDFTSFFESLGPHLDLLSADLRQLFKTKVLLILSELCKKAIPNSDS